MIQATTSFADPSESSAGSASDSSPPLVIRTEQLTRRFGPVLAVDHIHLEVPRGAFFGFLGPNGAGKSTTIKMLTGLLAPSSGRIEVLGREFSSSANEIKRRIGVVPEDMCLFDRLTGAEYLHFAGRLYGLRRSEVQRRAAELLELMELANRPRALIVEYSHGMKKKLSLAAAIIHSPDILFLDEPFSGVDAVASWTLKDLLSNATARGTTIFLTSHVLEIVEKLCSHVAIIHQGRIAAQGPLEQLKRQAQERDGDAVSLESLFLSEVGERSRNSSGLDWLFSSEG